MLIPASYDQSQLPLPLSLPPESPETSTSSDPVIALSLTPGASDELLPSDFILMDSRGKAFSGVEIFGIGAGRVRDGAPEATSWPGSGDSGPAECVVCLTEEKAVLLLPCR